MISTEPKAEPESRNARRFKGERGGDRACAPQAARGREFGRDERRPSRERGERAFGKRGEKRDGERRSEPRGERKFEGRRPEGRDGEGARRFEGRVRAARKRGGEKRFERRDGDTRFRATSAAEIARSGGPNAAATAPMANARAVTKAADRVPAATGREGRTAPGGERPRRSSARQGAPRKGSWRQSRRSARRADATDADRRRPFGGRNLKGRRRRRCGRPRPAARDDLQHSRAWLRRLRGRRARRRPVRRHWRARTRGDLARREIRALRRRGIGSAPLLRENVHTLGLGGQTRIFRRDAKSSAMRRPASSSRWPSSIRPIPAALRRARSMRWSQRRWLAPGALVVIEEAATEDVALPSA